MNSIGPVNRAHAPDRLFFAILPDDAARARITTWYQEFRLAHGIKGKAIDSARYHITLHLIGDFEGVPQPLVIRALAVAERFKARGGVEVKLDRARSFARPGSRRGSPFVLSCSDADTPVHALHRQWVESMQDAGVPVVSDHAFNPHLTLAYDRRAFDEQTMAPVCWFAREIVLMHSLVGQGRYVPLARVALD